MALNIPVNVSLPEAGLTKQDVITATTVLCNNNAVSATLLVKALQALTNQTDNWANQANAYNRDGLTAQYLKASLNEVLSLPGEIALLQLSSSGFILLFRQRQQWHTINAVGEPLATVPDSAGNAITEAIVLRMPQQKETQQLSLTAFSTIWPVLRSTWLEVGFASLFINFGLLLMPLFSMLVYDKVVSNGVFETLWALTFGMGIYLMTDMGMRVVRAWSTEQAAVELTRRGDEAVWQRLITQNEFLGGFAKFLSHYRDLSVSRDFVSSTYLLAIADLPFLLLYLLAIGIIAWPLVIVSAILVSIYAIIGGLLQYKTNKLAREVEQKNTQKLSYMSEMLSALEVVKTVPKANYFLRNWRELSDNTASVEGKRRLISSHSSTLAAGMMTFSTVAMLVAGVYLIDARALSVGGLIACNLLSSRAMSLVTSLFMVIGKWQDFQRASKRMESSITPVKAREYTSRQSIVGNVSIIKLTKQYPDRPTALDAVSFEINSGERIALLGKPGAGKSTLLRCIAGLSKQDSGQILIDGLSLEDIVISDKARWLAWKSQDPAIFAGTLEENLLIAGSHVGSEQFLRALWASGLEDEFKTGRITLGMKIDERGANLSGGQRQKIALARAFAQPSRILLLDEPTLGLDPDSEHLLAERLPQLLKPEDVLVMTTHSAIMLSVAQRVIALDGGRVIADGPRDKLVRVG